MKKIEIVFLVIALALSAIIATKCTHFTNVKNIGMRIVVCEGNKVVEVKDIPKGKFYFFLTHQGVYYNNTSQGQFFHLTNPKLISKEHLAIVWKELMEVSEREKGEIK